jgi:hypothetical protein
LAGPRRGARSQQHVHVTTVARHNHDHGAGRRNLGVDVGDVDVLLEQLDERDPQLPDELAAFLRRLLDPHDERTAPASSGPARTQSAGAPTGWVGPDRAEDGRALILQP